ncbi:MAG: cupredoxin domain-containing protein [Sporichthyaceae bacterium]
MFDTFFGLPLHVFVLHATVVLLPLGAIATVAVILRPAWRAKYLAIVTAANVGLLVLTFVTVRAGYALQDKLGGGVPSNDHEKWGEITLWIMVGLALACVLTLLVSRRYEERSPAAVTGLAAVVAALAVASGVMTTVTGHTGSDSHWGFLYAKSSTAEQAPPPAEKEPSGSEAKPNADVVQIAIKDFKFVPEQVEVKVGQKIKVTNMDTAVHTLTANDKSFDSGDLAKGKSYTFTVQKAGKYPYFCIPHQFMTGSLTVS